MISRAEIFMSLISEIKKKSQQTEAPQIELNNEQIAKLKKREAVIVTDNQSGKSYLIHVKIEKDPSEAFSKEDLEIEKITI